MLPAVGAVQMKLSPKPRPGRVATWFSNPAFEENTTSGNWFVTTVPLDNPSKPIVTANACVGIVSAKRDKIPDFSIVFVMILSLATSYSSAIADLHLRSNNSPTQHQRAMKGLYTSPPRKSVKIYNSTNLYIPLPIVSSSLASAPYGRCWNLVTYSRLESARSCMQTIKTLSRIDLVIYFCGELDRKLL